MLNRMRSRYLVRRTLRHRLRFLIFGIVIAACGANPLTQPMQLVREGMSRDAAVNALQQEAWYYQSCSRGDWIDDLFFFGSRSWNSASILIVTSKPNNQAWQVVDISSFDEAGAWQTAYADCLQRNKFAP